MIIHTHHVAGNLPKKTLVAKQRPTMIIIIMYLLFMIRITIQLLHHTSLLLNIGVLSSPSLYNYTLISLASGNSY